jgi:hypothetical protein
MPQPGGRPGPAIGGVGRGSVGPQMPSGGWGGVTGGASPIGVISARNGCMFVSLRLKY